MTRERVIGNAGSDGMPWSVPEEYNKFLRFIRGQAVIMGRRSFDIFQGDMSSSIKFVVSRTAPDYPAATVCRSLEEAIEKAKKTGKVIFIAGGGTIYEQAIPYADKMYLSTIKGDFTGNTYFPAFDASQWKVTHHEHHPRFEFCVYERQATGPTAPPGAETPTGPTGTADNNSQFD